MQLKQAIGNNTHLREAIQVFTGVAILMAALSYPAVWSALSLNAWFFNPMLIIIYFAIMMMSSLALKLPAIPVFWSLLVYGGLTGSCAALAVEYGTVAINGGNYDNTVTKALVLIISSSCVMFIQTILRFKYPSIRLPMLFSTLLLAQSTSGSYYIPASELWKSPMYALAFLGIAGIMSVFVSLFVLPNPAGRQAKRSLAKCIHLSADVLLSIVDLATGEVHPMSSSRGGRLVRAEGVLGDAVMGMDVELSKEAWELHYEASVAGLAIKDAISYASAARYDVDIYGATHIFPFHAFFKQAILVRSLLSNNTVALYPVQSGHIAAHLLHLHRPLLLGVATRIKSCSDALGDTLECNAPISKALAALDSLIQGMTQLDEEMDVPPERGLDNDALSLYLVYNVLFTATARLLKCYKVLPAVLAMHQPDAATWCAPVLERALDWEEAETSKIFHQQAQQTGAYMEEARLLAFLETKLPSAFQPSAALQHSQEEEAQDPTSEVDRGQEDDSNILTDISIASSTASEPEGQEVIVSAPELHCRRWTSKIKTRLGACTTRLNITNEQLRLALQMVVAYVTLMVIVTIRPTNEALYRPVWAVIIVVVLMEPVAGLTVHKAVLRLLGTLAGAAVGLGLLYLGYLVNGLSDTKVYAQKYVVVSFGVALSFGVAQARASADVSHYYAYLTFDFLVAGIALAGYEVPGVEIEVALWRLALTGVGLAVSLLSVVLVFPVTAKASLRNNLQDSFNKLATTTEAVFTMVLLGSEDKEDNEEEKGSSNQGKGAATGAHQRQVVVSINYDAATNEHHPQLPGALVDEEASPLEQEEPTAMPTLPIARASGILLRDRLHRSATKREFWGLMWRQLHIKPGPQVLDACDDGGFSKELIGPVHLEFFKTAFAANLVIADMSPLIKASKYEVNFPPRISRTAAFKLQRLCRYYLNVLSHCASSLDAQHVQKIPLSGCCRHAAELLLKQLLESMKALGDLVATPQGLCRILDTIVALERHIAHLLILSQVHRRRSRLTPQQRTGLLSLLAAFTQISWVIRHLCLAIISAFYPGDKALWKQAEEALVASEPGELARDWRAEMATQQAAEEASIKAPPT